MKKKWLSILIVLVMIANIITLSMYWYARLAAKPPKGKPERGAAAASFLIQELQFSAAQEKQYKLLIDEHQQSIRKLNEDLKNAKEAYFNLLESAAIDSTQQMVALNKLMQTQQQLEQITFKHFAAVKALCTPEQQAKFNTVIKKAMRMMGPKPQGPPPGGGRRGGPPPPHENAGPPPQDGPPPPPSN